MCQIICGCGAVVKDCFCLGLARPSECAFLREEFFECYTCGGVASGQMRMSLITAPVIYYNRLRYNI